MTSSVGGGVTWLLVTGGQLVPQLLTLAVASPSPAQMTAPTFSVAFHSARFELQLSLFQRDFLAV